MAVGDPWCADVANVSNFVRLIKHASVKVVPSPSPDYAGSEYYRVCVFEVRVLLQANMVRVEYLKLYLQFVEA